jgi:hypothetical protein
MNVYLPAFLYRLTLLIANDSPSDDKIQLNERIASASDYCSVFYRELQFDSFGGRFPVGERRYGRKFWAEGINRWKVWRIEDEPFEVSIGMLWINCYEIFPLNNPGLNRANNFSGILFLSGIPRRDLDNHPTSPQSDDLRKVRTR